MYSEEIHNLYLFGREIPLKLRVGTFTAYRDEEITRSQTDCAKILQNQREAYEENFFGEYEIVSCEEKYFPEEGGVRLIADYVLRGNIAVPQEIELSESVPRT